MFVTLNIPPRVYSIKTRIKTFSKFCALAYYKNTPRVYSIKTRIKTLVVSITLF